MDNKTVESLPDGVRCTIIIYTVILIAFGTVGNILLLSTIFYKRFRRSLPTEATEMTAIGTQKLRTNSTSVVRTPITPAVQQRLSIADQLLSVLTVTDTLCLWIIVTRYLVHLSTDYDIRTYSVAACKFHTFLTMILSDASTAILCIFAAHRAVCIRYPLISHHWFTRSRMKIITLVAFLFIMSKHLPSLFLFTLLPIPNGLKCDVREDTSVYNQIYYNFEFITHAIFGYLCLIVANILLFVSLAYTNRVQTAAQAGSGESPASGLQIARVILLFSFIQLITAVPFFILIELSGLYELFLLPDSTQLIMYYILTLAIFSNCGINFYMLLGISERFRKDFAILYQGIRRQFTRRKTIAK
ncbi:hypothetical protein FBUS_00501 [Fasciolopsis buskii]|uniref:G-protein coupled receptors family 1 profile domain-containing protein n=1 Tax=Fasciolopsis buskii TaxID=27845 RepID=A0A8E0RW27_9TREM|nr:hypothetical protein FBUS_00501 [Fasciolopsis buski]